MRSAVAAVAAAAVAANPAAVAITGKRLTSLPVSDVWRPRSLGLASAGIGFHGQER